ncbi:hypothetical protein K9L27_03845 [Candidatus Gracilibacteria bacterium]|nr:hypothetical protein [Candidatus Gracilibacteria bacterium]
MKNLLYSNCFGQQPKRWIFFAGDSERISVERKQKEKTSDSEIKNKELFSVKQYTRSKLGELNSLVLQKYTAQKDTTNVVMKRFDKEISIKNGKLYEENMKLELLKGFDSDLIIQEVYEKDKNNDFFHIGEDSALRDSFEKTLKNAYLDYKQSPNAISRHDFQNKCENIYIKFLRQRASRIPGEEFVKIIDRAGGMGNIAQELKLPAGSMSGVKLSNMVTDEETRIGQKNIQQMSSLLDIPSIPKDRVIDGIRIHEFIQKNNVRTYSDLIKAVEKHYGFSGTIQKIMWHESKFDQFAISDTYCVGIGQASRFFYGKEGAFRSNPINPLNPVESIIREGAFLRDLNGQIPPNKKGNVRERELLRLYNNDPNLGYAYSDRVAQDYALLKKYTKKS